MKGLLIAALAALGALLLGMAKADLEDEKVCRWLARKLMYRATECLPADERDRWREELIRDLLDLQGRIAPLGWALSVYLQAGRWGRERGVPSRREMLAMRVRLMWERLRSLTAKRALARSKQRHPASRPTMVETTQVVLTATAEATATIRPAGLTGVSTTRSSGSASLRSPYDVYIPSVGGYRDGLMHLSDQEFVAWLAQERRTFEDDIDRTVQQWRQTR